MEENIYQLLAKKSIKSMSTEEISSVEKSILKESGNTGFLSDLSFIEENSQDFLTYQSFEIPSVLSLEIPKANNFRNIIISLAAFLLLTVTVYFMFFASNNQSTIDYQIAFLPDGSEIRLDHTVNSSLKYSSSSFLEDRTIELKGNAFFDVAHMEDIPFEIHFGENTITVLGTSFFIFEEEELVKVRDGKVRIDNGSESLLLTEGEAVSLSDNKITFIPYVESPAKLFSGSYKNTKLEKILNDIANTFTIDFTHSVSIQKCEYNGEFKNTTLKETLDELSLIFDLTYTFESNSLNINSVDCK